MSVLEDFKIYCRDKGKYNLTDFNEIVGLFADFEAERKARKNFYEDSESASEEQAKLDLSEEDSDGYFSNLFNNFKN